MNKFKNITVFKLKFINIIFFIFTSIIFEIIFYSVAFNTFLPTLFFLDLLLLACVSSIVLFFKTNLFDKIYIPIFLFILCMCFSLNAIFYKATGNIFILENLLHLDLIFGRAEDHSQMFSWPILITFLSVYLVLIFLFLLFNVKITIKKTTRKSKAPLSFAKFGIIFLTSSVSVYSLGIGVTSVIERRHNNFYIDSVSGSPVYNVKKIGLLSFYVKNLGQMFSPLYISEQQLIDYFTDSEYLYDDFTGVLKDYNVVTIMIETGGDYMLNQYTTPNLYKILNTGINCSHNYSKNRTLYSELLGITGNIPGSEFKDTTVKYNLPYSLPNLLSDYDTAYFADIGKNNDVFGQKELMRNLGYKNCYYHYDLMPEKEEFNYGDDNWERDSDVFKLVIDKMRTMKDKFYIHYSTMCMHARYTDEECRSSLMDPLKNEFKNKLDQYEKEGLWANPLKGKEPEEQYYYNYTLCTMDFDKGLGELLDYLETSKKLDNTLIVVYGDHDIGGYTTPEMSWQIKKTNNKDEIANYSTILGFYNPKLSNVFKNKFSTNNFTNFTSPMVIVPTTLDLLGIKFNPKFYHGKSIFDPKYSNEVFYSMYIQRFMNENYLSNIGNAIDKTFYDNKTQEQFLEHCSLLLEQQQYIDFIYDNNIFNIYDYSDFMPKNK